MLDRNFLLIFIFRLLINIINCLLFINKLNNIKVSTEKYLLVLNIEIMHITVEQFEYSWK
jgi:hypothetical protein